jgi:hypothetical protein
MENNYIVECRNKDALNLTLGNSDESIQNGDWVTNLQSKIMLEEGDQVICRNSYVDTKAESQDKIIIPEDIDVTLQWIQYMTNWNGVKREYGAPNWTTDETSQKKAINQTNNTILPSADGDLYIMCRDKQVATNFKNIPSVKYQGVYDLQNVGGFMVIFRYYGLSDTVETKQVYLPKFLEWKGGVASTIDINIIFDNTRVPPGNPAPITCYIDDGTFSQEFNNTIGTNTIIKDTQMGPLIPQDLSPNNIYDPAVFSQTFTIPKNNYDAEDLCTLINTQMTKISGTPSDNSLTNNNLLVGVGGGQNINSDLNNFIQMTDESDGLDRRGFVVNTVDTGSYQSTAMISGASQFVLTYKDDISRFSFQFLHTPLFSKADGTNGSDVEQIGWAKASQWAAQPPGTTGPDLDQKTFPVYQNSGIMFTDLSPQEFWSDTLGFDVSKRILKNGKPTADYNPNCILVNPVVEAQKGTSNRTVYGQASSIPVFSIKPKLKTNLTGGFIGVAASFSQGSNFQTPFRLNDSPATGETTDQQLTVGLQVNDIDAHKTQFVSNGTTTFGYFLIEVQANFQNNYLSPTGNFRNIMAIVSRYYEKASYTSSSSADSIIYTHSGEPQILNSFRCRILNSNKELSAIVGIDNTILLEVVKAPKVLKKIKSN